MSHVYAPDGRRFLIAAKGAPEAIVDLCHLSPASAERVRERVRALASELERYVVISFGIPEPPGAATRGLYVDPIYF